MKAEGNDTTLNVRNVDGVVVGGGRVAIKFVDTNNPELTESKQTHLIQRRKNGSYCAMTNSDNETVSKVLRSSINKIASNHCKWYRSTQQNIQHPPTENIFCIEIYLLNDYETKF